MKDNCNEAEIGSYENNKEKGGPFLKLGLKIINKRFSKKVLTLLNLRHLVLSLLLTDANCKYCF